jgi:Uma2 family endonuclease
MTWNDVITDPNLRDLPYKIELDGYGQIIMSPASNHHGYYQGEIQSLLKEQATEGKALVECSIDTDEGVKVADVAWLSDAFFQAHEFVTPYPVATELCVEVISPSNAMEFKRDLYFSQGAKEVWVCDHHGKLQFFVRKGLKARSTLFPNFPSQI